jgi:hypothetical protein
MKNIFFVLILAAFQITAQEKSLGDFTKVTAFDKIDVMLILSDENKVIMNGAGSEDVELINKNGELKIRMPLTKILKGDDVSATVYYSELKAVEANEGSRISSESVISATDFDIIIKEGSIIDLSLDVNSLTVKMNDGSKINLKGKATSQEVVINSGSIYKAENLQTNSTIITSNTGAEAFIRASNLVEAKSRAGGNISIYGKPKQINKKTIAGGKIYEKED